jgi:hypothetical protein
MALLRTSTEEAHASSLPGCYTPLDTSWFDSVIGQINSVTTATQLQRLVDEVYGDIALVNSTIESQLAYIEPLLALVTAPTDPAEVITWITNFISGFLEPLVAPYTKYATQAAALEAQVISMTAEIEAQATRNNWTIAIPPVDPYCII